MTNKRVKCIVFGSNDLGERDFEACIVKCTKAQYNRGEHRDYASCHVSINDDGFVCDEHDPAWWAITRRGIDWSKVYTFSVKKSKT